MQKSMIRLLSIADVVSLTNAIFGFLSIIMILIDEMYLAFSLILLAILADGLDGIVARKIKHSNIGESLDSIADVISAGIAPSVFVYASYQEFASECICLHSFLIIVLTIFLITSIIRLASFHILKNNDYFVGLPAPASTIILILFAFLGLDFIYVMIIAIIISLTMITSIRFPKPGIKMDVIAAVLIILTLIIGIFGERYTGIAPMFLLVAILIYSVAGPIYFWKKTQ